MRRPFFMFLIALLLLRGWAGEAMATEMATGRVHPAQAAQHTLKTADAIETVASTQDSHWAEGNFDAQTNSQAPGHAEAAGKAGSDCAGHGERLAVALSASTGHETGAGDCGSCAACQACHTVALSMTTSDTLSDQVPATQPHSPAARFASALAALGQKPPIS
jgi:hypothetical protein